VSTNQLDDVVSTSAALTATSFTGPGYGSDPVLFVRRSSNRHALEIFVNFDRSIDSDQGERWEATGRLRWDQDHPIQVTFNLSESREAVFVPEAMRPNFLVNLRAGRQLILEVPGFRGAMTATFNPPATDPFQ
jgi:hypothetical protein